MKKIRCILLLILLLSIPFSVQATPISKATQEMNKATQEDSAKIEDLYQYISKMKIKYEVLKDVDLKDYVSSFMKTGDGKFSFKKVGAALLTYTCKEMIAALKLLSVLVIISIICALITNLQQAFHNENLSNIAYFACYSLVIIIMSKSFYIGVEIAKTAMESMTDFMAALMPILFMLLASVGGFTEATIMDPIVIGTVNISGRIFINFILPIILVGFVLQFVNSVSEEFKIDKLTKLINQIVLWTQGILMTVFIGIMTIRGITSKTIDQVTMKTAKFAVDNFIPIVGKSLSDAIATVAGYSLLLKNALSSLGLIVIIMIVLFPILKILILAFSYKITAAVIEPISDGRLIKCISAAGDSLILLMSCLISVSVMFFIMIAIIASAGKMAVGG